MKHALHATLGLGLSLAAFSGVLLYRQLFDFSNALLASRAAGPLLAPALSAYSLFVGVLVAGAAAAGLFAGRRWTAPEVQTYYRRDQACRMVALRIRDPRSDRALQRWSDR